MYPKLNGGFMIKVDLKTIAEIFEVSVHTIRKWRLKGMPAEQSGKNKYYYNVKECMKWKYSDDWKYFYKKVCEIEEEPND